MINRKRYRWTDLQGLIGTQGMPLGHLGGIAMPQGGIGMPPGGIGMPPGGMALTHGGGPLPVEKGNIPLEHDFLAAALAQDEKSRQRELWLGLVMAAVVIALVLSGWGITLLAIMFCLAPLVGIGLEIFSPSPSSRE